MGGTPHLFKTPFEEVTHVYTYTDTQTPTRDDWDDAVESATDEIRHAFENWPAGHPLHVIVPGFLARTLAERLVIGNNAGFDEIDVRAIIGNAFAEAGVGADIAGMVADAVCDDNIVT